MPACQSLSRSPTVERNKSIPEPAAKREWSDEAGPVITEAEWRSLVAADRELSLDTETQCDDCIFAAWNGEAGALCYHDGEITAKNPDKPLIAKMVRIARSLSAQVQGDDGEVYREDGSSFEPAQTTPPAHPSLISRIRNWFQPKAVTLELRAPVPDFRVGQRVKNPWGEFGTILALDRNANGGLGRVDIRLDDGREQHLAWLASGLEMVNDPVGESDMPPKPQGGAGTTQPPA
jgi:hypothetical protein